MPLPYDALLFDADGTILDFAQSEKNALEKLRETMGCRLEEKAFRKAYHEVNNKIWLELEEGKISGKELKSERFTRFARVIGSATTPAKLSERYLTYLGEESHFLEGADSLIQKLSARYPMGVITNGLSVVQKARFDRPEFREAFREMIISEEVGTAKPGIEIFRITAKRMKVSLSRRILIIGDSLTSDIAGGINAGISTCWYNPGGWENQSPWVPDKEVRSFEELERYLLPGE